MTTLVVTLFVSSQLLQGVQAGGCYDDEDYRYYGDHWKDCEWIADNDRCDRVKDGHHVGKEYCPYSCGYCFVDHCYDDHDFRYMKIDYKVCVEQLKQR